MCEELLVTFTANAGAIGLVMNFAAAIVIASVKYVPYMNDERGFKSNFSKYQFMFGWFLMCAGFLLQFIAEVF